MWPGPICHVSDSLLIINPVDVSVYEGLMGRSFRLVPSLLVFSHLRSSRRDWQLAALISCVLDIGTNTLWSFNMIYAAKTLWSLWYMQYGLVLVSQQFWYLWRQRSKVPHTDIGITLSICPLVHLSVFHTFYQLHFVFAGNTSGSRVNISPILEVGHPGIWSRDINFWGTVLGIYLHFLRKIRFFYLMSRTY